MSKIKIFALGGQNEVGKNMYVVSVDDKIYVFEAGLKYADDKLLGVDYIIPNYDYLIENKDKIKGVFITHGHDDQMGALCDILLDIPDIPIYAGKFTLEIIKQDLQESNIKKANLIELKANRKVEFGSESIIPLQVSHALPDSFMYVLNTRDGSIVFTGNYIFDASMSGPYSMDIESISNVGKKNVLCLMSESLYAEKKGFTSPNHRAREIIGQTLADNQERIFFNIFETQIYRIQELFDEISKTSRNVVIMGKSLENIVKKGIELGYIKFDIDRLKTISHVTDPSIIVIISNEREKPYSSLKRILRNSDKFVTLNENDTVVILSPLYDSTEITATKIFNKIAKVGPKLIILSKKNLSPHSSSEDIMLMIKLLNPKYYLPVTGEYRHQVENGNIAKKLSIPKENIILNLNGDVTYFENGIRKDTSEKVKVDEILIDGKTAGDIGDLVLKDREMLKSSGIAIVNANIDRRTRKIINKVNIVTKGFIYVKENINLIKEAELVVANIIDDNVQGQYIDYNNLKANIRDRLGKFFYKETESKPLIIVILQDI